MFGLDERDSTREPGTPTSPIRWSTVFHVFQEQQGTSFEVDARSTAARGDLCASDECRFGRPGVRAAHLSDR
jgi:hypothetical protein